MPAKRPRDRKARIVDAAADLFARRGYAAVGIDDIGAAVGVTGPAIYRHFPGKEVLLAAVFERTTQRLAEALEAAAAQPDAAPVDILRSALTAALDDPSGIAVLVRERERLDPEFAKRFNVPGNPIPDAWATIIARTNPGIDELALAARSAAVSGPVAAVAIHGSKLSRARLDALIATSATAALETAVAPRSDSRPKGAWQPPTNRRDAILAGAMRLFRERGFHGVGVTEIADAAGISHPTLYHYYRSKAAILRDAFDRTGHRVAAGMHDAFAAADDAEDGMARLVRSYASVALDNVDLIVVIGRELGTIPPDERPDAGKSLHDMEQTWADVLRGLRPDLSELELRLLTRATLAIIPEAAQLAEGHPECVDDIAGVTLSYALGRSDRR